MDVWKEQNGRGVIGWYRGREWECTFAVPLNSGFI
jgi:hypothetical protein